MVIMNTVFPLLEKESMPAEVAWGPSGDGGMVWVAGGRGGQKAPAQQRRKVGEQETFLCIFLLPAGLNREGTESIPCDFLFKEGRHAKANFGIKPPNRSSHTSLTLNLRFLVLGVHPKAVE